MLLKMQMLDIEPCQADLHKRKKQQRHDFDCLHKQTTGSEMQMTSPDICAQRFSQPARTQDQLRLQIEQIRECLLLLSQEDGCLSSTANIDAKTAVLPS